MRSPICPPCLYLKSETPNVFLGGRLAKIDFDSLTTLALFAPKFRLAEPKVTILLHRLADEGIIKTYGNTST
jgi:hypothetical protein